MTDIELRELDCWIAEHFMGWRRLNPGISKAPAWEVKPSDALSFHYAYLITWESTSLSDPFQPTHLPASFSLVKREIERRGWEWQTAFERMSADLSYYFCIFTNANKDEIEMYAESEELAGCLVVKAAMESNQ